MRRAGRRLAWVVITTMTMGTAPAIRAAETSGPAPDFQEVYDLIRTHLAGVTPAELNRKAVDSLIQAMSPAVSLVSGSDKQSIEISGGPLVKKASLFEGPIAYIRVARVAEGLPAAVKQAYENIGTNRVNGVVLDLRFTGGDDYAAAGGTADLFVNREEPLLNWGSGEFRSKQKTNAIGVPATVLVNRETSRAAEALAAVMRESGSALIIGSRTAGQAMIAQEYPLKNGQKLRVATVPVRVGAGAALSPEGVKPDLAVDISPQDEQAYLADAFKRLSSTNTTVALNGTSAGTNRTRRVRYGEAELVRERREGLAPDIELSGRADAEGEKPVVQDPALARALDVLKGLAVVRRSSS